MSDEQTDPYLEAMLSGRAVAPEEDEAAEVVEAEAPVEEPEGVEQAAEDAEEEKLERTRDEQGRFASKEEEEAAEESAFQRLLKVKGWKSEEDFAQSYTELEKHLGELRTDLSSFKEQQARAQQQAQEQQDVSSQRHPEFTPELSDGIRERLEGNPVLIYPTAVQAWQQGNDALLDVALEAWREFDETGARRFERELLKAEIAQEYKQFVQPIQQRNEQEDLSQSLVSSWRTFKDTNPNLDNDFISEMSELAQNNPVIMSAMADGNQRDRVFENLRLMVAGRRADQVKVAQEQITEEQAEQNEAARKKAVVASASTAKALGGEGKKKNPGKTLVDFYGAPDESHLPYWERSDYVPD